MVLGVEAVYPARPPGILQLQYVDVVGPLFEWDDTKRQANLVKHGTDFAAIDAFDWETALIESDTRHEERRWVAIGYIGSRLHVVVYAMRGTRRRIISLRKANAREVRKRAEAEA